ncbi:MAG TPA: molybdopterin cofactor-binding domain-containing protein [Alphaproteobacteria bacterium]|jgi:CO/xanthine dehydrogenase Mo-binding subunit
MSNSQGFSVTRRAVLQGSGAFVLSAAVPSFVFSKSAAAQAARMGVAARPALEPTQLDTWLKIAADGKVTAFFGKMDMGQGVDVAIAQIVAEELDVKLDDVEVVMGDTYFTVNQGGASGSTGVQNGAIPLRNAAAEARRVLVEHASQILGAPADKLTVTDGVVTVAGDASKKVSYVDMIGGNYFDVKVEWNGQVGNNMVVTGKAKVKPVADYRVVGKPYKRFDIPKKIYGEMDYVTDVKVPGMVHARTIYPPTVGASVLKIDESSIKNLRGVRVVREKDFVAVVADKEWDAIKAREQLAVTWSKPKAAYPEQKDLYDYIRKATSATKKVEKENGNVPDALKGAARVVQAEYEWPFQSHASMGPGCAVVQIDEDGKSATVWSGSQKPHYTRDGIAKILGLPQDSVHGIWVPGPGSYGRNDAGDVAAGAALIAKKIGKPVRLQSMRDEGHAWDPKGPASVHMCQAGIDAQGNVIAYSFNSKGFSRLDVNSNESDPSDCLPTQLAGAVSKSAMAFGVPEESYAFDNKRTSWEIVPQFLKNGNPLRTSHLRDPLGPQLQFASEQFIDEVALAVNADPVEFRLKYLKNPRDIAAIKAVAEKAGWKPRTRPNGKPGGTSTVSGRGLAYARRSGSVVAIVAEVEVDRSTGAIWPRKFTVAHDCGLIINPGNLHATIEGNIVQGSSRAILEEVMFDPDKVTSVDWVTYPIIESTQAPETIDVVLIDMPNEKPSGAGEASMRPLAAAIANAVFDATGVRIRRGPLSPDRIKSYLGQA